MRDETYTRCICSICYKIKKDLDEALQQMTMLPSEIRSYKAYEITEKKLKTLKKI